MKAISLFKPSYFWYRLVAIIPASLFVTFAVRELKGKLKIFKPLLWFFLISSYALFLYGANARPYALWMLATWLLTKYTLEENDLGQVAASYAIALITPFALFQIVIASWWRVPSKWVGRALVLPLFYSGYLVANIEPFPFAWPGLTRFFVLGVHHFTWWIFLPLLFLIWRRREYLLFLGLHSLLFFAVVGSFFLHTPERTKTTMPGPGFMITERYFIFLLPISLYVLIKLLGEYYEEIFG